MFKTKCCVCQDVVEMEIEEDALAYLQKWTPVLLERLTCESCRANFELLSDEAAREETQRRIKERQAEFSAAWGRKCPEEFQTTTVDKLPDEKSREAYRQVMVFDLSKRGLVLHGPTGKGKTRSAWDALKLVFMNGKTFEAMTANQFANEAARRMGEHGAFLTQWINHLCSVDVLLIDDIGKRPMAEASEAQFLDLIETRTSRGRPMILTTEGESKRLAETFSLARRESVMRRITEFFDAIYFGKGLSNG